MKIKLKSNIVDAAKNKFSPVFTHFSYEKNFLNKKVVLFVIEIIFLNLKLFTRKIIAREEKNKTKFKQINLVSEPDALFYIFYLSGVSESSKACVWVSFYRLIRIFRISMKIYCFFVGSALWIWLIDHLEIPWEIFDWFLVLYLLGKLNFEN